MGASPSIGLPDLGSLTNKGASIRKRVPIVGRCLSPLPSQDFGGPRLDRLPRVERRRQFAPVTFITQEPNSGSDSSIGGRCRDWLRWWRGNPRTRSPLPRFRL
jgi:hypothetical protein